VASSKSYYNPNHFGRHDFPPAAAIQASSQKENSNVTWMEACIGEANVGHYRNKVRERTFITRGFIYIWAKRGVSDEDLGYRRMNM